MLNRRSLLLVFLLPGLLFGACKKESTPQASIDFGPSPGFQYRNANNVPMGGDATDWTADAAWNDREKQLFAVLNIPLDAPQQVGTWYSSVYPNQSEATTGFSFITSTSSSNPAPTGSRLMYVIVDKNYAELKRGEVAANGATVSFQPNSLAAGALYRLYYVCYAPGQRVYFRSHGDIKVE